MGIAEVLVVEKRILRRSQVSEGWWWKFLECQPMVTLRGDTTAPG